MKVSNAEQIKGIKFVEGTSNIHGAGKGLAIRINSDKSKTWLCRWNFAKSGGKRGQVILGIFDKNSDEHLTLANARLKALKALDNVKAGRDPLGNKPAANILVRDVVANLMASELPKSWDAKYRQGVEGRLKNWILPEIGHMDMASVERTDIKALCEKPAQKSADLAKKTWQTCGIVCLYAEEEHRCKSPIFNNAIRIPNVRRRHVLRTTHSDR